MTYDTSTGLIYFKSIPFTSEDVAELIITTKQMIKVKSTKNKQFTVQPAIMITDHSQHEQALFSMDNLKQLFSFAKKNSHRLASRNDFQ